MPKNWVRVEYLGYVDRVPDLPRGASLALFGHGETGEMLALVVPTSYIRDFHARTRGKSRRLRCPGTMHLGELAGLGLRALGAGPATVTFESMGPGDHEAIVSMVRCPLLDGTSCEVPVDAVTALHLAQTAHAVLFAERRLLCLPPNHFSSRGLPIVPPGGHPAARKRPEGTTKPEEVDEQAFRTFLGQVEPGDFVRYSRRRKGPLR